jgi:hypothetical protein
MKWRVEVRDASLPGYKVGNSGTEWSQVFGIGGRRIRARKGIRRYKESLTLQRDCDKSVARTRLVCVQR